MKLTYPVSHFGDNHFTQPHRFTRVPSVYAYGILVVKIFGFMYFDLILDFSILCHFLTFRPLGISQKVFRPVDISY